MINRYLSNEPRSQIVSKLSSDIYALRTIGKSHFDANHNLNTAPTLRFIQLFSQHHRMRDFQSKAKFRSSGSIDFRSETNFRCLAA